MIAVLMASALLILRGVAHVSATNVVSTRSSMNAATTMRKPLDGPMRAQMPTSVHSRGRSIELRNGDEAAGCGLAPGQCSREARPS